MRVSLKRKKREKGVTLLEFLIFFPMFLLAILIIIWIGAMANAKYSLVSALANGVRLAATRGDPNIYGKIINGVDGFERHGAITEIERFHASGDRSAIQRYALLAQKEEDLLFYSAENSKFMKNLPNVIATGSQAKLPVEYLYVIAYTVQSLTQSIGSIVRYPCDPRDQNDPEKGDNCLYCRPVNPLTLTDQPYNGDDLEDILRRRIAVRCDFKPISMLTKPIAALFGIITGAIFESNNFGIISYGIYFDKQENCYYDQNMSQPYCIK